MAEHTKNYNLIKQGQDEFYNVDIVNSNLDAVDTELKRVEDKIDNIQVPVTSVNNKTGAIVLTAGDVGAETPAGAQAKVNALAGAGNIKTVKQLSNEFDEFSYDIDDAMYGLSRNIYSVSSNLEAHKEENASTAIKGHVQLNNTVTSTSTTQAATANAVKTAYDRAEAAFQSASDGKNEIATAITGMGQSASGSDTFALLANKIRSISMDANAGTVDVLTGRTYYQGGIKRTGTMPNRGSVVLTPSTANQSIANGYHSGSGYVKGDANLIQGNVKEGVSLFGLIGTLKPKRIATGQTSGISSSGWWLIVSGLTFTPSLILAVPASNGNDFAWYSIDALIKGLYNTGYEAFNGTGGYYNIGDNETYVNSTGFKLRVMSTSSYNWIAFE